AHSSVGFSVKHLVISNTKGEFSDFAGTIMLDENDITKSSLEVTIKTASISTHDDKRDAHLRSADFFDVEKHPEITFKSKKVEKTSAGYQLTGDLTIRGVTKEVSFPFTLVGPVPDPWGGKRLAAQASVTVNRQEFGVSWNKTLDGGGLLVGDEVTINIEVEAVHAKPGTN
ncbi:MAG TPA: YceI family protein, partial [bacterium]